jgi:hypothetical protein
MHIVHLDKPTEPHALTIMDMSKGPQNASVRRPKIAIELAEREGRAGVEQLAGSPGGVAGMCEKEFLELRHRRHYNVVSKRPKQAAY